MAQAHAVSDSGTALQLVVFGLDEERLALPMSTVREIVRMLPLAPVPLAPPSVLGLANLRGRVLPVVDLRRLVGAPARDPDEASRILVLEWRGSRVGLVVDRVLRVLQTDEGLLDGASGTSALLGVEALRGVVRAGDELVQVIDLDALLDGRFEQPQHSPRDGHSHMIDAGTDGAEEDAGQDSEDALEQLVAFKVADQELALHIGAVREIVRLPEHVDTVPGAGSHALGLMTLRGRTLPLVSMAAMLGLGEARPVDGARVLVTEIPLGGRRVTIGLVVDAVREVLRVPLAQRDPLPPLLAQGGSLDEIEHVCRLDGGRRLVSVVDAERLGGLEAMRTAVDEGEEQAMLDEEERGGTDGQDEAEAEVQLVVFQLDGEEFALPVEVVQEITRVPDRLSRVPKTPPWIEGLVNLRGTVLPVLDMRVRFGLPRAGRSERQRILVLELGGARTGFVTDSVTEVLSVPRALIEAAPRLSEEQARLMGRVVNLADGGRMIVVLDPEALVDEEEREALAESVRTAA